MPSSDQKEGGPVVSSYTAERNIRDALSKVAGDCMDRASAKFKGLDRLDPSLSTAAAVVHARELGEGEGFATAAHLLNDAIEQREGKQYGLHLQSVVERHRALPPDEQRSANSRLADESEV